MTSFNDYMELRQAKLKRKQRIVAVVSAAAFLSSTVVAVAHFVTNDLQKATQPAPTVQESVDSQLKTQEKGYEIVLQREPNNQVALEGLVQVRLQMKDFKGAQQPLKRLAELNPARPDYQALLKEITQKISDRSK